MKIKRAFRKTVQEKQFEPATFYAEYEVEDNEDGSPIRDRKNASEISAKLNKWAKEDVEKDVAGFIKEKEKIEKDKPPF